MKEYKRNPLLKFIIVLFMIGHIALGAKMYSTDNNILGTITFLTGLYWVYCFVNEFTPYLKLDDHTLILYKGFVKKPQEFNLSKDVQIYYHSKERLVFTYLTGNKTRAKARIYLGYLDPKTSVEFVQSFRAIIAKCQEPAEEIKEPKVTKIPKVAKAAKASKETKVAKETKDTKESKAPTTRKSKAKAKDKETLDM